MNNKITIELIFALPFWFKIIRMSEKLQVCTTFELVLMRNVAIQESVRIVAM